MLTIVDEAWSELAVRLLTRAADLKRGPTSIGDPVDSERCAQNEPRRGRARLGHYAPPDRQGTRIDTGIAAAEDQNQPGHTEEDARAGRDQACCHHCAWRRLVAAPTGEVFSGAA